MAVNEQYERWLQGSRRTADALVGAGAHYHDALARLSTCFLRLLLEQCRGSKCPAPVTEAARLAQVDRASYSHKCRQRATNLSREALVWVRAWSQYLVKHQATYREARFIFRRSLLESAIRATKGNRLKASRMLALNRNMLWQIPQSPEKAGQGRGRQARRAA